MSSAVEAEVKVIGAGWGRTGTSSFQKAMEILGLGKCYHMNENFDNGHAELWSKVSDKVDGFDIHEILGAKGYQSTCDFPSAVYWREQLNRYPDAKVVLTYRDPEVWFQSFDDTIANMQPDNPDCPFGIRVAFGLGLPCAGAASMLNKVITRDCFNSIWSKENIIKSYIDHVENVKRTCPKGKLLVFEVSEGWEPLCTFLGIPIPEEPFPFMNDTAEYQKFVSVVNTVGYCASVIGLGLPAMLAQSSLIKVEKEQREEQEVNKTNEKAEKLTIVPDSIDAFRPVVEQGSASSRKLLHIVVSYNSDDKSSSKKVAKAFIGAYRKQHNGDVTITTRDLGKYPLQHLDEEGVSVEFVPEDKLTEEQRSKKRLRKALVDEIVQADDVLVSTPLWNWGPPSALKAYIDQIVYKGELDSFFNHKLKGKSFTTVIACGGGYGPESPNAAHDHLSPFLSTVFSKLGATDIKYIWTQFTKADAIPGMGHLIPFKNASFDAAIVAAEQRAAETMNKNNKDVESLQSSSSSSPVKGGAATNAANAAAVLKPVFDNMATKGSSDEAIIA